MATLLILKLYFGLFYDEKKLLMIVKIMFYLRMPENFLDVKPYDGDYSLIFVKNKKDMLTVYS